MNGTKGGGDEQCCVHVAIVITAATAITTAIASQANRQEAKCE